VNIATDAIDRLHSTASSHNRVMVIEVMGHKAGWIALYSGMAGGGDVILVPELPYDIKNINQTILNRLHRGKPYSIVVVAEGVHVEGEGRPSEYIARQIEETTGIETRVTVLGYIQRGGSPHTFRPQPVDTDGRSRHRDDCQRRIRTDGRLSRQRDFIGTSGRSSREIKSDNGRK
jgi:6-phosphofructokinase